jgi:hypothetical protein
MSVENRKVLEMLAAGKITSEDAERLMDKLAAVKEPPDNGAPEEQGNAAATTPKYLRIEVKGHGKDVNMRVPLSFVRSGAGLIGVLPAQVLQKLNEKGLDLEALSSLQGEKLNAVLNELCIDIDKGNEKQVRIFCE